MRMSNHATIRGQQRGISFDIIDLILKFGISERKPGNVSEYRLRKKDKGKIITHLKCQIQFMNKAPEKAALVDLKKGEVITNYVLY